MRKTGGGWDFEALGLWHDNKLFLSIFSRECETHKVTIYKGPTSASPIVKSICGFSAKQKVTSNDAEQIMLEFR